LKKRTNQRNSPYNTTTYVSEPPEKLQRTFMGDFEERPHCRQMMKYMEWHTQYIEQSNNRPFTTLIVFCVKEVHFDYGAASNGG
jgi:hypothetical protein